MKKYITNNAKGFTLAEMVIYVAIFSIFVASFTSFTSSMMSARLHNQVVLEVGDQGLQATRVITQALRNATAINTPPMFATSSVLSIATNIPATNPTVFSINGGVLIVVEGSNAPVALTNNKVSVSNFVASNLSVPATKGGAQIRFVVSSNIDPRIEVYAADFYGSGVLR